MLLSTFLRGSAARAAVSPERRKQRAGFLLVGACVYLGVLAAAHVSRAQAYAAERAESFRTSQNLRRAVLSPLCLFDLKGRSTLVVSDSMILAWPWEADRIAMPGHSTPDIRREFERRLEGRHYEQIILWPGTAHFLWQEPEAAYVRDTLAMIEFARVYGDTVVVLGPLPPGLEYYAGIAEATADTAAAMGSVPMLPLVETHAALLADGIFPQLSPDGIHLSPAGIRMVLEPMLLGAGIELRELPAGWPVLVPSKWLQVAEAA